MVLCNCMEKAKKVVIRRNMGQDNEIASDPVYNGTKFSMDTVCVDSIFVETKRGQDSAYNGHHSKKS